MNNLPITPPKFKQDLLKTLLSRRSRRDFIDQPLTSEELNALLFAACGVTQKQAGHCLRTAPSAGACYPIEVYAEVSQVQGLDTGIWKFSPEQEKVSLLKKGEFSKTLSGFALSQEMVAKAGVNFIFVYNPSKIEFRYGEKAKSFGILECGHIAQNILLVTEALGLGAVAIGAIDEEKIKQLLGLPNTYEVIYIISIGKI